MSSSAQLPSLPEMLATEKHRRRKRRSLRSKILRRIRKINYKLSIGVILSVIAILVMGTLLLTVSARNRVEDLQQKLERVIADIGKTPSVELSLDDFERLQASVADLNGSITSAKRLTLFLRPFTFLSADLETYLQSMDAAQELTIAAQEMLTGLEPTFQFLTKSEGSDTVVLQLSSAERSVELLTLGQGRFISARSHLETAQTYIDSLNLAKVSPDLLVTVDHLIKYQSQLHDIGDLLLDSPELLTIALGLEDDQTYLILSQNSDELRPSGGYISTYGWMTVRNGRITDYDYSPTTEDSPNPPPSSMAGQVQVPYWWVSYQEPIYAAWDGSWYVDFPSTAKMAAWYYDNGDNPHAPVNGVIAIDLVGFEYLMQGLESVTVPGYDVTVTPENFREVVYEIRAEGEGELPHKQFIAALYKQILDDWQNTEADTVAMRRAVFRALQEKHVMVYFTGEQMQLNRALEQVGWAGNQEPGIDHDYLAVVDANLGSKSNRSVVRQVTYDVEVLPESILNSRVTVSYDFSARAAEADPAVRPEHYSDINYHSILQVFVPANSTLTDTHNLPFDPDIVQSDTHTDFVSRIRVDYNSSERLQFSYTTPVLVESIGPYRRYELVIQKQPGTLSELVSVQIKLPPGAKVIHTSPEVAASYTLDQPILEFRLELLADEKIEVLYTE